MAVIIIVLGPLMIALFMAYFIALPGLIFSPIAGLIAWQLARNRWLNGGREALSGVVYSACLILPWILLIVALRRGSLSSSTIKRCYILLYLAWLIGPVIAFATTSANFQTLDADPRPDFWWVGFSIFWGMLFLWIGSAAMTLKRWNGVEEDAVVECLTSFRFILPYALACVCVWTFSLYALVWETITEG